MHTSQPCNYRTQDYVHLHKYSHHPRTAKNRTPHKHPRRAGQHGSFSQVTLTGVRSRHRTTHPPPRIPGSDQCLPVYLAGVGGRLWVRSRPAGLVTRSLITGGSWRVWRAQGGLGVGEIYMQKRKQCGTAICFLLPRITRSFKGRDKGDHCAPFVNLKCSYD